MSDKSIVTQSQLGPLKLALAQDGDSLAYHVNDSLSKAHGMVVLNGPNPDAYGNDLSCYRDSNDDIVGTKMMLFTVQGVNYFCPAISAGAVPGQNVSTGVTIDMTTLLQPGANSWITDYASAATEDAQLIMSGLMLPHTQEAYWEAHGGIRALVQTTLDSQNHIVGTHVIEIIVNQSKLQIPATTRLGGPAQPPKITLNPYDQNSVAGDGQGQPDVWMSATAIGTGPITFQWQYSSTKDFAASTNIALNAPFTNGYIVVASDSLYPPVPPLVGWVGTSNVSTTVRFVLTSGGETGLQPVFYIRCKFSNAGGDRYTSPALIQASDSTKWLCTVVYERGFISKEVYDADVHYARKHMSRVTREGYDVWAYPLAKRIRKDDLLLRLVAPYVRAWACHMAYLDGALPSTSLFGWTVFNVVRKMCSAVGYTRRALLRLKSAYTCWTH